MAQQLFNTLVLGFDLRPVLVGHVHRLGSSGGTSTWPKARIVMFSSYGRFSRGQKGTICPFAVVIVIGAVVGGARLGADGDGRPSGPSVVRAVTKGELELARRHRLGRRRLDHRGARVRLHTANNNLFSSNRII